MKNLYSLLILLAYSAALNVFGQAAGYKYSNEFLSIGVGARNLALSGAVVASTGDASSAMWNPAGLNNLTSKRNVSLMHAEYFAGIAKYDFGSAAFKVDSNQSVAISVVRFGVDNILNTTELIDAQGNVNYSRITKFSTADYAYVLSYARKLPVKGLTAGANLKVVNRIIGDFAKAWGFGLDVGVQYAHKGWQMGLMAKDITTTVNNWQFSLTDTVKDVFEATGNTIPQNGLEITLPRFILGVGKQMSLKRGFGLMVEANAVITTDGKRNALIVGDPISVQPAIGAELGFKKIVFLRTGLGNFQRVKAPVGNYDEVTFQPNLGIGINLDTFLKTGGLSLDYALTDIGDRSVAIYSNIFTLQFRF